MNVATASLSLLGYRPSSIKPTVRVEQTFTITYMLTGYTAETIFAYLLLYHGLHESSSGSLSGSLWQLLRKAKENSNHYKWNF